MEHYFYNFSKGVDVYNSLNYLHRDHNSTSFLISAVADLSKVSFKCPLNNKPLILKEIRDNEFKYIYIYMIKRVSSSHKCIR